MALEVCNGFLHFKADLWSKQEGEYPAIVTSEKLLQQVSPERYLMVTEVRPCLHLYVTDRVKNSLYPLFHLWYTPYDGSQRAERSNCWQIKNKDLYTGICITPFISLCLFSTVPGSTMDLYVYVPNLSVTADTGDRKMPIIIFPQLHYRGHIHTKHSHLEWATVMSENIQHKDSIQWLNSFIHATYTSKATAALCQRDKPP